MNQRLFSILTPILLALYPALYLFSSNLDFISFSDLFTFFLWTTGLCIAVIIALVAITGSYVRSCMITTLLVLSANFYQYPAYLLKGLSLLFRFQFDPANWGLFALWAVLTVWLLKLALSRSESSVQRWNSFFGVAAGLLVGLTTWQTIQAAYSRRTPVELAGTSFALHQPNPFPNHRPSIIYLILDGFGREDLLSTLYSFDNEELLSFLKKSGFYIAQRSCTNYPQTLLSLGSSLNGEYISSLIPNLVSAGAERSLLVDAIAQNTVAKFLRGYGYQYVVFEGGMAPSSPLSHAQFVNAYPTNGIVEGLAFDFRIPMIGPMLSNHLVANHRNRILATFDALGNIELGPDPRFIFAHIIAPHPPFVFDQNGTPLEVQGGFTVADGVFPAQSIPNYVELYRGQAVFIARKTIELVQNLLKNEHPPVIIIQGDHGPGSLINWENMSDAAIHERYPILNAFYLPSQNYEDFYPTISPVNSFRVIFNSTLDTKFEMLPEQHYFATWNKPFALKEISDNLCKEP